MNKVVGRKGFILFAKIYYREIVFSITFLILISLLFSILQKNLYCFDKNSCQFWAGSWGFALMGVQSGWAVCYFILGIVKKWKLSRLLKLLLPITIIFYCLGIYYSFGNYILIEQDIYITRNSSFESESKYRIDDFKYIYKSYKSEDGLDSYSIMLNNGDSVSIIDERVINFLNSNFGIRELQITP